MDIKARETKFFEMKKNTPLFDINCYIPTKAEKFLEEIPASPEVLLSEGLDKIVLAEKSYMSKTAYESNEALISKVKTNDNFFASPIITPEMCMAGNNFDEYLSYLIDNKAVIMRVFPKTFNHSMKKWQMGEILKKLEKRRIPLMIWHTETSFDAFAEVAENFPKLPIIIEGSDQKTIYYTRDVMALCEKFSNIYLEMHNFTQHGFLPYLLKTIGSERLLFGTCTPYNDYNGTLEMLDSHTTKAEMEQICYKNFENLMSKIKK